MRSGCQVQCRLGTGPDRLSFMQQKLALVSLNVTLLVGKDSMRSMIPNLRWSPCNSQEFSQMKAGSQPGSGILVSSS